jgi:hypothetical protein
MTFNIQIFDANHNHIADAMNASVEQVLQFLRKGMIVLDINTRLEITEETLLSNVGVSSECIIAG